MDPTPPYSRLQEDIPPDHFPPGQPPTPVMVTVDPTPSHWQQQAEPPKTEVTMVLSVLSIPCCLCLGIAATSFTSEASRHNSRGEFDKARHSLKKASRFIIASVVCGAIIIAFIIMLQSGVFTS